MSVTDKAIDWLINSGDTGMSSRTIWSVMMGIKPKDPCHPWDPSDLGRCLRLLARMPRWKGRMNEVAALSPTWRRLVKNWAKLESLFIDECGSIDPPMGTRAPRTYELMQNLTRPPRRKAKP